MNLKNSKRSARGWKTRRDRKALAAYEKQMRNRRKEYAQVAEATSLSGRRNRALAVGECVLQLYDKLRDLNAEKKLLEGTLFWTIAEQRLKDTDGKKGFRYAVCWHVKSDEDYYTEDEITEEIEKTRAQMEAETRELYDAEEPEGAYAEDDEDPPFEE